MVYWKQDCCAWIPKSIIYTARLLWPAMQCPTAQLLYCRYLHRSHSMYCSPFSIHPMHTFIIRQVVQICRNAHVKYHEHMQGCKLQARYRCLLIDLLNNQDKRPTPALGQTYYHVRIPPSLYNFSSFHVWEESLEMERKWKIPNSVQWSNWFNDPIHQGYKALLSSLTTQRVNTLMTL